MTFISRFRKFKKLFLKHTPLVVVTISKSRLLHNLNTYQHQYPGLEIAPVLKSNAYGHGLMHVAEILDKENLPFFTLDSYFEARTLRKSGIRTDLLIVGYTPNNTILREKTDCMFTITSLMQLRELTSKAEKAIRIHIKFDTGMHRQGLMADEVDTSIALLQKNHNLKLEGICSHFADADSVDTSFTEKQILVWENIVQSFKKTFPHIPHIHISASAGVAFTRNISGNVIRLGLGLYGIDPQSASKLSLKPVLQMESVVSSLRTLKSGDCVGYNCTKVIDHPSVVATVPVGYFEGVDRRLSNKGFFKIGDLDCPIVGRVSMNITSIDVSDVPNVELNDQVITISNIVGDKNSVEHIAQISGAIPWEILVHIPPHLYRKVVE